MEMDYTITVGKMVFVEKVECYEVENGTVLDASSLNKAQKKVAIRLLADKKSQYSPDIMDFCINISGLKAIEVADLMEVTPSQISHARRGKSDVSGVFWKMFRVVMILLFKENISISEVRELRSAS